MKTIKNKEYSFNHFKQRMKERHDLDMSREEYKVLCSLVKHKKPIRIEDQKNDTQRTYEVNFCSVRMKVVWSGKRQCLTTVLPRGEND